MPEPQRSPFDGPCRICGVTTDHGFEGKWGEGFVNLCQSCRQRFVDAGVPD